MREEDNYLFILNKKFKGNKKKFEEWLEAGEPYNKDGSVKV